MQTSAQLQLINQQLQQHTTIKNADGLFWRHPNFFFTNQSVMICADLWTTSSYITLMILRPAVSMHQ